MCDIDIEVIKDKMKVFTDEEREFVLHSLSPIHFKENVTDDELQEYIERLCEDYDNGEPFSENLIDKSINLLFKDKNLSVPMQEYLIDNYSIKNLDLNFDIDVLVNRLRIMDILFEELPKSYKTDQTLILAFGAEGSFFASRHIRKSIEKYITISFVKSNYDNIDIMSPHFGRMMLKKARSKKVKTYLMLKFGAE